MESRERAAIVHEALVVAVDRAEARMRVKVIHEENADCSSCAAALLCRRSSGNMLTIALPAEADCRRGDRIRIAASSPSHRRAVMLMLVLPCLLTIISLVAAKFIGLSDGIAALCSIAAAACCYLVLFLLRRRVSATVTFRLI